MTHTTAPCRECRTELLTLALVKLWWFSVGTSLIFLVAAAAAKGPFWSSCLDAYPDRPDFCADAARDLEER